jgi:hypothetical protein
MAGKAETRFVVGCFRNGEHREEIDARKHIAKQMLFSQSFPSSLVDLDQHCNTDLVIYMSLNLTCQFLVASFKMCEFELLTSTYRSCTLLHYGGIGRTVQPHKIVSKYIHQCADPKPAHGSDSTYCEERFQNERMNVTDPGDRGHTKVTGECPACKAAEEKCLEVHIVRYNLLLYYLCLTKGDGQIQNPNVATRKSDAIEPVSCLLEKATG